MHEKPNPTVNSSNEATFDVLLTTYFVPLLAPCSFVLRAHTEVIQNRNPVRVRSLRQNVCKNVEYEFFIQKQSGARQYIPKDRSDKFITGKNYNVCGVDLKCMILAFLNSIL